MEGFKAEGKLDLSKYQDYVKRDFVAASVSEEEVKETIAHYYKEHEYTLDPHTAVGVYAAAKLRKQGVPVVCLATAHPAKFGKTVEEATGDELQLPDSLADILNKPSRCEIMAASKKEIKAYIEKNAVNMP